MKIEKCSKTIQKGGTKMPGDIDDQVVRLSEKGMYTVWKVDFYATKLSARLLLWIAKKLLSTPENKIGKQTVKQLQRKGASVEKVPIASEDLKQLRRELNRYGVDYSLLREKGTGKYTLFFKGQDATLIRTALEKCLGDSVTNRPKRRSIRKILEDAVTRAKQRQEQRSASRSERSELPNRPVERNREGR